AERVAVDVHRAAIRRARAARRALTAAQDLVDADPVALGQAPRRRGLGGDLGDAADGLVARHDRELLARHANPAVVLREVRPAEPDRLDLEHGSAGRRLGLRELADLVRTVAHEHRRANAHATTSWSTTAPSRRIGTQKYGDAASPSAAASCTWS